MFHESSTVTHGPGYGDGMNKTTGLDRQYIGNTLARTRCQEPGMVMAMAMAMVVVMVILMVMVLVLGKVAAMEMVIGMGMGMVNPVMACYRSNVSHSNPLVGYNSTEKLK